MNWLSLTPWEVAGLWSAAAALAVWLYLRARVPARKKVSSLYFWADAQAISQQKRRRIRDPLALLAQLIFLLLLILALANVRWGSASEGRRVAIILDNSIWSQQQIPGGLSLMDNIRQEALRTVDALPPADSVLLMSAGPDAPPILPFTTDHVALRRAIAGTHALADVADVPRALRIGESALGTAGRGVLIYIGPGMVDEQQAHDVQQFRASIESAAATDTRPQFLMRLLGQTGPMDNHGITRLSLARDDAQPDRWHLLTQIKNYEPRSAKVTLSLSVNGRSFVTQPISLAPGELANVKNEFVWAPGGTLQADISPSDSLNADNRATISIPGFHPMHVAVFSTDPIFTAEMHSALDSNPFAQAEFVAKDSSPKVPPDIAIYQGMSVPDKPAFNSIWFLSGPSAPGSPPLRVTQWNSQHPVTRWVRTHDVSIRNPAALSLQAADTVLASQGTPPVPLIVAREQDGHRLVLIGFNPHDSNFPQESAFPLLVAGSMEWLTRPVDALPSSLSVGEIDLPEPVAQVFSPSGKALPLAHNGDQVHLFADEAGLYRVLTRSGEASVAVNPPLLPSQRLTASALEVAGPEPEPPLPPWIDFWRWLLLLALIPLWLEWWFYYSGARKKQLSGLAEMPPGIDMENRDPISGRTVERSEVPNPTLVSR